MSKDMGGKISDLHFGKNPGRQTHLDIYLSKKNSPEDKCALRSTVNNLDSREQNYRRKQAIGPQESLHWKKTLGSETL